MLTIQLLTTTMPSIKEISRPRPTLRKVASQVKLQLSVIRGFMDALSSDPKYMQSIRAAFTQDTKYRGLYDEYARTGKATPLAEENDAFSLIRYRSRTGGPAGPPMEGDYNDKHVYVCTARRTLTVHHWLFFHPTLVIDLDQIVRIRPARNEAAKGGDVEAWGVGVSGVGWARDARRTVPDSEAYNHSYVCEFEAEGEVFEVGFTVQDPVKFEQVLERLVPGIRSRCTKTKWMR